MDTLTDMHLRHGYTLADLHRLARKSAGSNRSMATDHRDLLETAWSAIAEHLYSADDPPSEHDLLAVGRGAIWAIVHDHRTTYGYRDRQWDAGMATAPRFCAYWLGARVAASPEEAIVERLTLPRLMDALSDPCRAAILALAAHDGDRAAAAAAMGLSRDAFNHRIHAARRTCLRLWLEHETPPKARMRHPDRRWRDHQPTAECGTPAAAARHRRRKEPLCERCAAAETAYDRERRARRMQRRAEQAAA